MKAGSYRHMCIHPGFTQLHVKIHEIYPPPPFLKNHILDGQLSKQSSRASLGLGLEALSPGSGECGKPVPEDPGETWPSSAPLCFCA